MENSTEVPPEINDRTTIWSNLSHFWVCISKGNENGLWKGYLTPMLTAALFMIATRGKEILSFAITCMDLKGINVSEISQVDKDKYSMISLINVGAK